MKTPHATNDLERKSVAKPLLKNLLRRKAEKPAPASDNLKEWAESASKSRNKS